MTYAVNPVVETRGLTKKYGSQVVLDDVSFSLAPGVHALLGPNGAGKTTLVNILSTLIPADGGTAAVLGHDVGRERTQVQRRVSVTGQFAAVDDVLTGTENMMLMGQLLGLSPGAARRRGRELLEHFALDQAAGKRVATYSGGMRRKLDLAISLIGTPQLLFLDEPTTGLDTRSRQALWDQITVLAQAGTSVFLTTQYLEEADLLADRILVLDRGTIVADGTAADLKAQVGGALLQVHDSHGRVIRELPTDGTTQDLAEHLVSLAASDPEATITVRRPSLDEAFLQLTGHHTEASTR